MGPAGEGDTQDYVAQRGGGHTGPGDNVWHLIEPCLESTQIFPHGGQVVPLFCLARLNWVSYHLHQRLLTGHVGLMLVPAHLLARGHRAREAHVLYVTITAVPPPHLSAMALTEQTTFLNTRVVRTLLL